MNIQSKLLDELIFLQQNFDSPRELFSFVAEKADASELINPGFLDAISKREEEFPTGLQLENFGVAIPHTDAEHIKEEFIAVVTLDNSVPFKAMDGSPEPVEAKLVFILGLKEPEGQLATLQTLMQVIQDDSKVEALINAEDSETIIKELS